MITATSVFPLLCRWCSASTGCGLCSLPRMITAISKVFPLLHRWCSALNGWRLYALPRIIAAVICFLFVSQVMLCLNWLQTLCPSKDNCSSYLFSLYFTGGAVPQPTGDSMPFYCWLQQSVFFLLHRCSAVPQMALDSMPFQGWLQQPLFSLYFTCGSVYQPTGDYALPMLPTTASVFSLLHRWCSASTGWRLCPSNAAYNSLCFLFTSQVVQCLNWLETMPFQCCLQQPLFSLYFTGGAVPQLAGDSMPFQCCLQQPLFSLCFTGGAVPQLAGDYALPMLPTTASVFSLLHRWCSASTGWRLYAIPLLTTAVSVFFLLHRWCSASNG